MKTFASLLLISSALVGTSAFAQNEQTAPISRAQVVAELHAAQASGQLVLGETAYYPQAPSQAQTLSREQVVADLRAAQATGQVGIGENQTVNYPVLAQSDAAPTRAEVVAELRVAQASGEWVAAGRPADVPML